ncbi:hypothetical protein GQ55_2G004700 [Panicum hallii var. hallii]|uniref:Dirigent protein n=1 Tax=Panicum hallii var. hallii TaxID=1504633 RepID=A0A2T7EK09_9POAL|nr:hypothetical protein GQ55_2G004700 [Panicum hallii var. hallii]
MGSRSSVAKQQLVLIAAALVLAVASARRRPVHLRLYMHDITGGPGRTAVPLVNGTGPLNPSMPAGSRFGDTTAIDDLLTEGLGVESEPVGRAQGTYMLASLREPVLVVSMTVVLTAGPYNGSVLVVAGRDSVLDETRELAVVGGTGQLRRASGHVLWRTARLESAVHWVLELDVHASVPADDTRVATQ